MLQKLRRTYKTGALTLSLPILAALGACQSAPPSPASSNVRIGFGVGATAKPSGVVSLAELLYYEPIIGREVDGQPTPYLAEAWAWENADKRVRVRLKKNIRFHQGQLLTADLIARALQAQVAVAREQNPNAFDTVARIWSERDDVVVDLLRPDALLLSELFGLRVVHPDDPDNGTGPFRIVRRTPQIEAVRFDGYHSGVSQIGKVTIVTYDSQRSAWAALMRGEVDAVQEVSRESVEFLAGSSTAETYSFLQSFYIPLVFNVGRPALADVEVRRAITEGLDREAIIARAMHGHGKLANGPVWPLHWAYSDSYPHYSFDPDSAARRLDRAGFPVHPPERPGQPAARFSLKCLFWSEDPQYERIALMIQRQLFDIGINIELEPATLKEIQQRVSRGDFDTFLVRTNASRTLDITYRFWRSTGINDLAMQRSGYSGADALLDAFRVSTSEAAVRDSVNAISRRFYEDAPAAFIAWTEITRALDSRFEVPDVGAEDPFAKIWRWQPGPRDHGQ
jgi:ABC-type transport system substrate-binding protein